MANRGTMVDADKLAEIKEGESTREDVAVKLGTPTQVSTFDENKWYYIGRRTKQYSFLDPEVIEQKGVEISFDEEGKVKTVSKINLADAKDIDPVSRKTPTYGIDNTFLEQLVGNLRRPIPKGINK